MSAWKEFKKKIGNTPLALFDSENKVPEDVADFRMKICLGCEHLIQQTQQCSKCLCFMKAKTTIKYSYCPIGKWQQHEEQAKDNE
jgi:hypothetical protein